MRRRNTSINQFAFNFDAKEGGAIKSHETAVLTLQTCFDDLSCSASAFEEDSAKASFPAVGRSGEPAVATSAKKESVDYGRPDKVAETLKMLERFERNYLAEGKKFQRRLRIREDQISLGGLARALHISPTRLKVPIVVERIEAMVARVGIEPFEESDYVQDILSRIEELANRLRPVGGKMPRNPLAPLKPNFPQVRKLLGVANKRLPEAIVRRITELYDELGIEEAPQSPATKRLLAWVDKARAEGLLIPACEAKPDEPHIPSCVKMTGFPAKDLYFAPHREILRGLGSELGYEIVTIEHKPRSLPSLALVEEWLKRGEPIPQHPSFPGRPWMPEICQRIGLNKFGVVNPDVKEAILIAAGTRGYVTVIQPVNAAAVLLGELREKSPAMRREAVSGTKSENAQVANLKYRLNQLAALHPDGDEAEARPLLEAAAAIKPGDHKFHGEMETLRGFLDQIERSRGLPEDFCNALRELCKRAKLSFKAASREAALPALTVRQWANACPAPNRQHEVELIEQVLKAEPLTLVSRMVSDSPGNRYIPLSRFREHIQRDAKLRGRIVSRLRPTDFALSDPDFIARCDEIEAELKEQTKPRSDFKRARSHALSRLPDLVERQYGAICKVASTVGHQRRQDMNDLDFGDERLRWSKQTIAGNERTLKAFFGFLSEDVGPRRAIGLNDMSLALAVVPKLAFEYALWLPTLRMPGSSGRVVSVSDIFVLKLFVTLLRPRGLLRQMSSLADTLRPIPGYLDTTRITWIKANWPEACEQAWETCRRMVKSYSSDEFDPSEDLASLMPILNLDDPSLAVFGLMLSRMSEARAMLKLGSLTWAMAVRDEMYLHLQEQMALREETLRQIAPPHFRQSGSGVTLHLPREFFKNRTSEKVWKPGKYWINFERDFDNEMGGGEVYDLYVNVARPLLIGTRPDPATFFVTEVGTAMQEFNKSLRAMSLAYLIDHPDADDFWKQQGFLTNHDFRHLMVTSIIRQTGDWADAAHALMDTIETVEQTYGFLRAKDRSARFRAIRKGRGSRSP